MAFLTARAAAERLGIGIRYLTGRVGVGRGLAGALAGLLLVVTAANAAAQTPVQQILMLHSLDRGNLILDYFTGNFRVDLDLRVSTPMNIVQVVVGPSGLTGPPEGAVVDYIRSMFPGGSRPELVVTVGGPAAVFARKYRASLFPDVPLLFASVDQRFLADAPLGLNEAAVAVANDFPGLVDDILQLRPQTRQVFMVMGSGQIGRFWSRELEEQFKRFQGRLTFIWSNDLSLQEILRRCASLPADAAILYLAFSTDGLGGAYADERVLADLHATAKAPLFSLQSPLLGHGIVGGRLMSIGDLSRSTAEVATRILNGAPPRSMSVPPQSPALAVFDARELQRWNIPESRLPPGSVVHYRSPTLWQEYRAIVLAGLGALAIQSLLIGGLLYQRRARQRAELDSRRNLALAADASRRQTMSALTGSMAHELGQPLGVMMHNAEALQMMVAANRATPDSIGEILADIHAQGLRATQIIDRNRTMLRSHQLDRKPIDLRSVLNESLRLVAHDMQARQVKTTVHLPSIACVIDGDQVLLQQVFVNLLVNAMDAMVATPPSRRRLSIGCDMRATDVEVSVHDDGTGVAPEVIDTLFTPFTTTKSGGLGIGLTIVRTILDAHGGTIAARNNSDGGATFTVTLRRSGATLNTESPAAREAPSAPQHEVPPASVGGD